MEENCAKIARHIKAVTGDTILIHQMTLYFKVDANFDLWLILCTNVKFKDPETLWKNSMPLKAQQEISLKFIEEVQERNLYYVKKDVCIDKHQSKYFQMNPNQSICATCYSRLDLN